MTEINGIYPSSSPDAVLVEESLSGVPEVVVYVGGSGHLDREGVIRLRDHLTVALDRFDDAAKAAALALAEAAAKAASPLTVGDVVTRAHGRYFSARVVITDEGPSGRVDMVVLTNDSPHGIPLGTVLRQRTTLLYRRVTAAEEEAKL